MVKRKPVTGQNKSGSNNEHAKLSPSSASQWGACPASVVMKQEYPDTSGDAAKAGTAMHTVSEVILNDYLARFRNADSAGPYSAEKYIGSYVANGGRGLITDKKEKGAILITDDMAKMCDAYVQYWVPTIHSAEKITFEQRVNLTKVLGTAETPTFGTADVEALIPVRDNEYMLIIGDLKTGRNKVFVESNDQLMLYALGSLARLSKVYNIVSVRLVIFQPYCGGASESDVGMECMGYAAKRFYKAAQKAMDALRRGKKGLTSADFVPSVSGCKWCRHNEKCAAALNRSWDETEKDLGGDSLEISPQDLAAQYQKLEEMENHIARIKKAMYSALLNGTEIPGFKLAEGNKGPRKWTDQDKVIAILKEAKLPRRAIFDMKLISPTSADKDLKKDFPEVYEKIEGMVTRANGAPVIVPASDPRPAFSKSADESDLN